MTEKQFTELKNEIIELKSMIEQLTKKQVKREKKEKSSKYRGVSFDKRTGKFRAQIYASGKIIHGGYFDTEIEAAKHYDRLVIKNDLNLYKLNFHIDRKVLPDEVRANTNTPNIKEVFRS